jgi:hypothetical protein
MIKSEQSWAAEANAAKKPNAVSRFFFIYIEFINSKLGLQM